MRWLLGREIDHMIKESGASHERAGQILKIRRDRVADLVEGTRTITVGDLERLVVQLGFGKVEGYLDSLESLRSQAHRRGHWKSGFNRAYPDDLRLLVQLERAADLLRVAQVEIVPGLLQCEAYVRALHDDQRMPPFLPSASADVTTEDYVAARIARQEIMQDDTGPEYRAVLSESCLMRRYGSNEVMRQQADHLLMMSKNPRVTLQILPFDVQAARAEITQTFVMLRVPSPGIASPLDVVYSEGLGKGTYDDTKTSLVWADATWSRLSMAAMNPDDSRLYIKHIADRYYSV
jgi:hypothetical protein